MSAKSILINYVADMDHSPTGKAPFEAFMRRTSLCKRSNNVAENHEVGMYVAVKVRRDRKFLNF